MAAMLSLIQQVCNELGISSPNAVASSTDQNVIQLLALMNRVGNNLVHEFEWNKLSTEYRFTTQYSTLTGTTTSGSAVVTGISDTTGLDTTYSVTGTGIEPDTYIASVDSSTQVTLTQAANASGAPSLDFSKTKYSMPSDYDRLISRTDWDKTNRWEILGPETPQQWQYLKSGIISTGPRARFRILGGYFQVWPPLVAAGYYGFEYISSNWALSNAGVGKSSFTADTDTSLFPDHLLVLGTKLKYFEIKGFDTFYLGNDYQNQLALAKSADKSATTLSMAPKLSEILIGIENIPDSGYGNP